MQLKKRTLWTGSLIVLAFLVGSMMTFAAINQNWFGLPDDHDQMRIDPDAEDWVPGDITEPVDPDGDEQRIAIPGYPEVMTFAEGTRMTHIGLFNPEGNPCYFVFELAIGTYAPDAAGQPVFTQHESLYTSQLVPPGQRVPSQQLSRALDKGTYDVAIMITTYSLADQSSMNGAHILTQFEVG